MAVVDNALSVPASGEVLMIDATSIVTCAENYVISGSDTVTCQNIANVGTLSVLPTCVGESLLGVIV